MAKTGAMSTDTLRNEGIVLSPNETEDGPMLRHDELPNVHLRQIENKSMVIVRVHYW